MTNLTTLTQNKSSTTIIKSRPLPATIQNPDNQTNHNLENSNPDTHYSDTYHLYFFNFTLIIFFLDIIIL